MNMGPESDMRMTAAAPRCPNVRQRQPRAPALNDDAVAAVGPRCGPTGCYAAVGRASYFTLIRTPTAASRVRAVIAASCG